LFIDQLYLASFRYVDQDEMIALNAWHHMDRQTREAIKRNFLPQLLEIYEVLPFFNNSNIHKVISLDFSLVEKIVLFVILLCI
jgi:hypothetical protein